MPVERKKLSQWFLNIKKFSQNLLDELEKLKNWPEKVKLMQKNWIGKSYGCEINFKIKNSKDNKEIRVFTTRPDTIFGATFVAISCQHPLVNELIKTNDKIKVVGYFNEFSFDRENQEFSSIEELVNGLQFSIKSSTTSISFLY